MSKQKKSLAILICLNIIVACFVQFLCSSILSEKIDMPFFQFVIFPLIFVIINILMAIKLKAKFYEYVVSVYLGFFCSIFALSIAILIFERPEELPPGEIVVFADVLLIIFISIVQMVILLFMNLVIYTLFKIFFSNKLLKQL